MTVDTAPARPLPAATIAVAGVSFRQPLVARLAVDAPITVTHDPDNPHDDHACEVRDQAGQLLGFVPKSLNRRVVARIGHAGTAAGTVVDVLNGTRPGDTVGLRIRLT